jgi:hypothetical protein
MLLKLSKPLASGSPVCVRETFSGANAPAAATFNAVVLAASARVQTQPATLSIEPAADGDARLMIDPLAPAQGLSATVHVYSACPPSATAKPLDAAGIPNTVGADGQKFPIRLTTPVKAGDRLCAVETYAGNANVPNPLTSATIKVDAAAAAPEITDITQFTAPNPSDKTGQTAQYVAQIAGINLPGDTPQVALLPAPATAPTVTSASSSGVLLSFTAPQGFSITQAVLSYKSGLTIESAPSVATMCRFDTDISSTFQFIDASAAKTMYGAGVSGNFRVIKLSVVNQCPLPVTIPLAGIKITGDSKCAESTPARQALQQAQHSLQQLKLTHADNTEAIRAAKAKAVVADAAAVEISSAVSRSALDAVTAFYTEDKSVTGHRALFFNSISAIAAVGSGIEPFIGGRAFAQAIAFVGGGFTSSAKLLYQDMSAQQLQALTSLGFGNAEQLAARGGPLQKYLFISRKIEDKELKCSIDNSTAKIEFIVIPTVTSGVAQSLPAPATTP